MILPRRIELTAGFRLSPYFRPRFVTSMQEAERLMLTAHGWTASFGCRSDFARRLPEGDAEVQVLVNGTDANRARIVEGLRSARGRAVGGPPRGRRACGVTRAGRRRKAGYWFNEANDSHYFLVPGLIVLVMTLLGAFMTALVMAREWERGTFEALFVTPVRADEILLGKLIPYFLLGLMGLVLCLAGSRFLFHVPLRGSMWLLVGASMLYLLVALGIGLVDLVDHEEPVHRQPDRAARDLSARDDALRLHLRSATACRPRCVP